MRVLIGHNYYQRPGGEDRVYRDEAALLEGAGHEVIRYEVTNDAVDELSKVNLARATVSNRASYDAVAALIEEHRPDVAHFHNTFPLISPAAYRACRDHGVPVVQTLHNYRLLCPAATLYLHGGVCEKCLTKTVKWPAVVHACYRDDRRATAVTSGMLAYHLTRGTYRTGVDRYVALTEFARRKFVEGGLPAERMVVKGNSVPDRGVGPGGDHALFVGRLTPEKGIATLLEAWEREGIPLPLKIAGDGPMRGEVQRAAAANDAIEYLGHLGGDEVVALMRTAAFLVFPSRWYETFGLTIAEAFACGTPVVASDLGAAAELVQDGVTGTLFPAGDAAGLAAAARALLDLDPERLRRAARASYEARFTPAANLEGLTRIYASVRARAA